MAEDDKRGVAASAGGAIGMSTLAAIVGVCCAGPFTVALFGVPGAVLLAKWQPARPYLLGAATLMLAWAFWRVYRPRPVCADGICPPRPPRWLHVVLWTSAAILLFAFVSEDILWWFVDPTPAALRSHG